MSGSPVVAIVMATYNGSHYIREQLSSILNQTYKNIKVYISDDNSSDSTVDIIKDFIYKDSRVSYLGVNGNPGVVNNFNKALCSTTEDIIFLCDQDDIWPEDRINNMLDYYYKNKIKGVPTLIYTDMKLIDADGNEISPSFYNSTKINPEYNKDIRYLTWRCTAYGCTMLFDRDLLKISLPLPNNNLTTMHDNWLILCAVLNGNVYYMKYCSILYRQHDRNHTGGGNNSVFKKIKTFKKQIKTIDETKTKRFKQLIELKKRSMITDDIINIFQTDKYAVPFVVKNIFPFKNEKLTYSAFYALLLMFSNEYKTAREILISSRKL